MRLSLKLLFITVGIFLPHVLTAQILKPVKWSYASKKVDAKHAIIYLKADIDEGWHIYSVNQPPGGPLKTSVKLEQNGAFGLNGKVTEPQAEEHFEKAFGINVFYFEKSVIFQQKILLKQSNAAITGKLSYMACNDHQCLPPEELDFEIPVK